MKVYFTASIVGRREYEAQYRQIVDTLTQQGAAVQADHILKTREKDIRIEPPEKRLAFHKKLETWIAETDMVVAETSYPSISVGFEISLALHRGKPVLILYSTQYPPSLLAQYKDERLVCEHYTDSSLKGTIEDFLSYASSGTDHRFTFFLPPVLANHLDRMAKIHTVPKSVYLRQLIEHDALRQMG